MDGLLHILEMTLSPNPADQETAVEFLREACSTQYPEFLRELSTVLCETDVGPYVRQAAGLQLKNTLVAKEAELVDACKKRWLTLPAEIREHVKGCVLKTLGTESKPSTAAQCLAAISSIELPENQWPDLIDALKDNVTSSTSSELLKESSLESLGYICQDLPTAVMESKTQPILIAIVDGMRVEENSMLHVRLAATTALLNSLEIMKNCFENEYERKIIMGVTCTAAMFADTAVKVIALQCLVKIVSLYYQFMEGYMIPTLRPITLHAIQDDNNEVARQGIEFWSNVCEVELNIAAETKEANRQGTAPTRASKHYSKSAQSDIAFCLMQVLLKWEYYYNLDEWTPIKAARGCIMFLSQCCDIHEFDTLITLYNYIHLTNIDE